MGKSKDIKLTENQLNNIKIEILKHKSTIEDSIFQIGTLLIKVKENLPHGYFMEWVENEVEFKRTTANNYMKVVTEFSNYQTYGNLGQSKIFALLDVKKEDRDSFINNTHDIEGVEKSVEEMSVRELSQVIKEYKHSNRKSKEIHIAEVPNALVSCSDIENLWQDTVELNKEILLRRSSNEDIETTVVARYNAKEITHQELIDIIANKKLQLPIYLNQGMLDDYLLHKDYYYSEYREQENSKKYSIFYEEFLNYEKNITPYDEKDEGSIDYAESNHVDNNEIQLVRTNSEFGDEFLLLYKEYTLLGQFFNGNLNDISEELLYIYNISKDTLKNLYYSLELKMKQYETRSTKRFEEMKKRREKYDAAFKIWNESYQPYSMGKYKFEDIWDEEGNIHNYKLYSEMTSFVRERKKEQYNSYESSWSNFFGSNKSNVIKDEDKANYKRLYRILAKQCHPDIAKDDGELMQLVNKLKENWGI